MRHGLVPLICVGETLAEREAGRADEVLTAQTEGALRVPRRRSSVGATILLRLRAGLGDRRERHPGHVRLCRRAAGADQARSPPRSCRPQPPVLYGGSVNPGNAAELIACPHIDGLFIGRSAWARRGLSRHPAPARRRRSDRAASHHRAERNQEESHENRNRRRQRRRRARPHPRRAPEGAPSRSPTSARRRTTPRSSTPT